MLAHRDPRASQDHWETRDPGENQGHQAPRGLRDSLGLEEILDHKVLRDHEDRTEVLGLKDQEESQALLDPKVSRHLPIVINGTTRLINSQVEN